MLNAKAYRLVQLDARGPWATSPRRTVVSVTGQEWLPETFGVIIRAFDSAHDVPGITAVVQYQDARERWWDMDQDEVNEFLEMI